MSNYNNLAGTEEHNHYVGVVKRWLREHGYAVFDISFENRMNDAHERIRYINDPTSLYLRTGADLLTIHHKTDKAILIEVKTERKYPNLAIELLPYLFHQLHQFLDVRCLYIIYDSRRNLHKGFWLHDRPAINRVVISPSKCDPALKNKMMRTLNFLESVNTNKDDWEPEEKETGGSNDPHVIIKNFHLFPDWQTLLTDHVEVPRQKRLF